MEEKFIEYLNRMISDSKVIEQRLVSEDRKDEANIERIRSNIMDIFKCLWNASVTEHSGETDMLVKHEKITKSFLDKAYRVPQNWRQSLEKARLHDDTAKILIEETKLKTADEITAYFTQSE